MSKDLVRYDAMCRAIAEAYAVDEVKDVRDKAMAWEMYSRQAKNVEAERDACEIRLRAERKAGELLKRMEKAQRPAGPGRGKVGQPAQPTLGGPSTLKDLGISKGQSSKWQKLADMPTSEFEHAVSDRTSMPSTNGILRSAQEPKVTAVSTEALWLWGRLRDFERDGLLDRTPAEIMATMTDEMKDDVHLLAPRVAAWLKQIGACS